MRRILFDLWYLYRPPWDTRVSPPELMAYIGSHPAGAAIDLGCGTGTNVITLAEAGWRATGVDFSRMAIRNARRRTRQAGQSARLLAADLTRPLPLKDSFDLALDIGCLHMLRDQEPYLQNLLSLLAVGGHWLMYGFLGEPGTERRIGLTPQDIDAFTSWQLRLLERQDGLDRGRRSAWFLFERIPDQEPAHASPRPSR